MEKRTDNPGHICFDSRALPSSYYELLETNAKKNNDENLFKEKSTSSLNKL